LSTQPPDPRPASAAPPDSTEQPLETGHVLFLDVVGYSRTPTDEQRRTIDELNALVRATDAFERAEAVGQLVCLPTGDGLALVFFGPNLLPAVSAAFAIARELRDSPIKVRMGVHSGPVYRLADINRNRNVAGGGINYAQRVMDCGDAGHILVSSVVAEVLHELAAWRPRVHSVGTVEVKHGVALRIFNLYDSEVGNPAVPRKIAGFGRKVRRHWARVAATVALVAGLVGSGVWYLTHQSPTPQMPAALTGGKTSVALLGCKNLSGRPDTAWLSTALTQMLATELASGREIRTIPGESVARAAVELRLPESDTYSAETLAKIRRNLGVDLVVVGSYVAIGGGSSAVRVDLRIQDATNAETVGAVSETGNEQSIFDLISRLGSSLRRELGIAQLSAAGREEARRVLPATTAATRYYAEGLQRLRVFDTSTARQLFEKAVAEDPSHAPAHSALSETWAALGYYDKAVAAAEVASALAGALPLAERLQTEARYLLIARKWKEAQGVYERLIQLTPDSLDAHLELSRAKTGAGDPAGGVATLETARRLPFPLGDDPRIDIAEAQALAAIGDHSKRLVVAERAIKKGIDREAALVVAQGTEVKAGALFRLGRLDEAVAAASEARDAFAAVGDRGSSAMSTVTIGGVLYTRGDRKQAQAAFEEALAVFTEIGRKDAVAGTLNNLANIRQDAGDLDGAIAMYTRALEILREVGPARSAAIAVNNLANTHARALHTREARRLHEEAAQMFRDSGDLLNEAVALRSVVWELLDLGEIDNAYATASRALTVARRSGNVPVIASLLSAAGGVAREKGDVAEARALHQEALGMEPRIPSLYTSIVVNAADLALDSGDVTEASRIARKLASKGESAVPRSEAPQYQVLLARIALAENRRTAAAAAVAEALRATPQSRRRSFLRVEITAAEVAAATNPAAAVGRLERVAAEAQAADIKSLSLDALLAAGQIEARAKQTAKARERLTSVQRDAERLGFKRIATSAAALLSRLPRT
jgi:tetratricopeptide (TPR) repeat protein